MVEVEFVDLQQDDHYSSEDEQGFSKLLSSVSQLDSTQRVKPASRKELSSLVSEFHLSKVASDRNSVIHVKELAKVLGQKSAHVEINKKLVKVTKTAKTLPKPLEKPAAERIQRVVGFENVKQQLNKWNAIVESNRVVDHITYPLAQKPFTLHDTKQFRTPFKNQSELEIEVNKILHPDGPPDEEKKEEDDEFPLTLEEMLEKRKEMARLRAKQSFREAKAHRQNKIKSKKYHRLLKREKVRQQMKEFELLQKTDPEAALRKLEELDKTRAQERASLRHKNTGKWAKNLAVRAKYDKDSRKELAQQLSVGRDLTQKAVIVESSEDEEEKERSQTIEGNSNIPKDNPWAVNVSSEVTEFIGDYQKYWEEKRGRTTGATTPMVLGMEPQNKDKLYQQEKDKLDEDTVTVQKPAKETTLSKVEVYDLDTNKSSPKRSPGKSPKQKKEMETALANSNRSPGRKTRSPNQKKKIETGMICFPKASGTWVVTPIKGKAKKRQNPTDLDDIFDDVESKVVEKLNKKMKAMKERLTTKKADEAVEDEDEEAIADLSMKKQVERMDLDEALQEMAGEEVQIQVPCQVPVHATPAQVDPNKFIKVAPKHLQTKLPDSMTNWEEAVDDEEDAQQMTIMEAFGDDDVIAEFKEMKANEEETTKLEVTTELPGWGNWAGTGIVQKKRKKRIILPKLPPRKDQDKDDTIINEEENPKMKDHQVKEVPFPFQSVSAFEANIRNPLGREWVPETAHKKLIKRPVETVMGAVIPPMDEEELMKFTKKKLSLFKGKTKSKKN